MSPSMLPVIVLVVVVLCVIVSCIRVVPQAEAYIVERLGACPVSYTHLTLPTICSV